jgi:hypothetical protein
MSVLSLIVFLAIGDSEALFTAICSASGAICILAIRANVWNKKKIIKQIFRKDTSDAVRL